MRIINTNIKKAQGILEGFFRDATDGQIPDVNQQILLINCLCKELSIELFSHEEGMILVKDTRQIRIPDAWEKEVITIPCENGDAYYLVFPFPTLKRDTFLWCDTDELEANSVPDVEAFHGQFREYHGEILRLVDKITRSLGRYDKQSWLYNAAYITQLHEHPEYSRKYDFYRMTLWVKNGSNAILPSIGEVQACIRDCLRGIGNGIIPWFSRTTHTFLFAIPKWQTINPRDYFGGYLKSFPHVRPSFTPLDR